MTKVDDLETYILDGKEFLSTYSIRKLLVKVEGLGFTKYACEEVLKRFRNRTESQTDQTPNKITKPNQPPNTVSSYCRSQTAGAKFRGREGNSPDRQLRSLNMC